MILAFLPIGPLNCCKKLPSGGRNRSRYSDDASFQTLVCLATKFSSEKPGITLGFFDVSLSALQLVKEWCMQPVE
jgi:hypothetical protein